MAFIKGIGVENYKLFKDRTDFEFAPITVLTGTNSSGKSSVINLMKILQEKFRGMGYPEDRSFWTNLVEHVSQPFTVDHIKERIGGFKNLISRKSGSDEICFYFPTSMRISEAELELRVSYKLDETGKTQNGIFSRLEICERNSEEEILAIKPGNWGLGHVYVKVNYIYFYNLFLAAKAKNITPEALAIEDNSLEEEFLKSQGDPNRYRWTHKKASKPLDSFATKNSSLVGKENLLFDLDCFGPKLYQKAGERLSIHRLNENDKHDIERWNIALLANLSDVWHSNFWDQSDADGYRQYGATQVGLESAIVQPLNYSLKNMWYVVGEIEEDDLNFNPDRIIEFPVLADLISEMKGDIEAQRNVLSQKKYETSFGEQFFNEYVAKNLKSCFEPLSQMQFKSVGSQRTQIKSRLENINDDTILDQELKEISKRGTLNEVNSFLQGELKRFKIADSISIEKIEDTNFYKIWVRKGDEKFLLADEGNGIGQVVPILIGIVNFAFAKGDDQYPSCLLIEEPEANLHPALQSKLADMFYEAYQKFNIQFIIETHSEYLIRKMQYLTAKGEMKPWNSQIYYFYHPKDVPPGQDQVKKINILEDGSLTQDFGVGFFDEADRIALSIWNMNNAQKN